MNKYSEEICLYSYIFVMEVTDERIPVEWIIADHIRDGMGESLRKNICIVGGRYVECLSCRENQTCMFPPLFLADGKDKRNQPRPFVLHNIHPDVSSISSGFYHNDAGRYLVKGETFSFGFTLFGSSVCYLPFYICSFKNPDSKDLHGFRLKNIYAFNISESKFAPVFSPKDNILRNISFPFSLDNAGEMFPNFSGDSIRITFTTQTRIKTADGNRLVTGAPEFFELIRSILLRMRSLSRQYWNKAEIWISDETYKSIEKIRIEKDEIKHLDNLYRKSLKGYTNLKGIIGSVTYKGNNIRDLLPFLQFGSFLQIGKTKTMGCGKYRVELSNYNSRNIQTAEK